MNNGFSNISGPTINGLVDIKADTIASSTIATTEIVLNGVDISTQLNQVPINASNITALQQLTTGISYSDVSSVDMTTINNNLTITSGKKIKCATIPTANDDLTNKLYVDGLVGKVNLTNDISSGEWYIPFSKTTTATGNSLYIDTTTTPLKEQCLLRIIQLADNLKQQDKVVVH